MDVLASESTSISLGKSQLQVWFVLEVLVAVDGAVVAVAAASVSSGDIAGINAFRS